ncbi:MAG: hypothetical protein R3C68_18710 [Myxococcota bacterium]
MRFVQPMILVGFFTLSACGDADNSNEISAAFSRDDTEVSVMADPSAGDLPPGTYLTLASSGVSSANVSLNDRPLFQPSDFHNRDFVSTQSVDLDQTNTIYASVRGSPGDQLCVRVFEIFDEPENETQTFFEECIDRQAGPPNTVRGNF